VEAGAAEASHVAAEALATAQRRAAELEELAASGDAAGAASGAAARAAAARAEVDEKAKALAAPSLAGSIEHLDVRITAGGEFNALVFWWEQLLFRGDSNDGDGDGDGDGGGDAGPLPQPALAVGAGAAPWGSAPGDVVLSAAPGNRGGAARMQMAQPMQALRVTPGETLPLRARHEGTSVAFGVRRADFAALPRDAGGANDAALARAKAEAARAREVAAKALAQEQKEEEEMEQKGAGGAGPRPPKPPGPSAAQQAATAALAAEAVHYTSRLTGAPFFDPLWVRRAARPRVACMRLSRTPLHTRSLTPSLAFFLVAAPGVVLRAGAGAEHRADGVVIGRGARAGGAGRGRHRGGPRGVPQGGGTGRGRWPAVPGGSREGGPVLHPVFRLTLIG
jgi:hypothetical protein